MTIQRILARKDSRLISVPPDMPIGQVVGILHGNNIGAVLVMDGPELLGVLSERGIVRALALNPDGVRALPAKAAMRVRECDIAPSASVDEAMEKMTNHRVRYLPVIEEGRVTGVLSIGDVVKDQLVERALEVETLTSYISGS